MKCSNNVERLECLGPFTIAEERFCVLNITNDKTIMAVAIAGGISGPGRALVEAISAQKTHEVIVLTRKVLYHPGNTPCGFATRLGTDSHVHSGFREARRRSSECSFCGCGLL